MSNRIKVIQISTGNVGTHALRGIIDHPDLDLAGLWVHSPERAGQDAGVLAGVAPNGVLATNDLDALLASDAQMVCYCSGADQRMPDAIADFEKILRAGKNIVSPSLPFLTHPPQTNPYMRETLEAAAIAGNATCFISGIDPGFANDLFPLTVLSVCRHVEEIRVAEILNYATYNQPRTLFEVMGFGQPMDEIPMLLTPGILTFAWGGVIQMMSDAAGIKLDDIVEVYEREAAPHDIEITLGTIKKGTAAGLRFELRGMINGRAAIVVEHVTRIDDAIAPHWPQAAGGGVYRITVRGAPNIEMEFHLSGEDGDHNTGGLLASAQRLVHAIPQVVAASPGLIGTLDLLKVVGRGVF